MKIRYPLAFAGVGSYVPEEVVPNQYFIDRLDTTDEWIVTRTGIRERRRAAKDEVTSTLALKAARKALADAGKSAQDLDLIIVATATGDCQFPSAATFLQQELGCPQTPAFDIGAACAGFLHATSVAAGLIAAGMYKTVLVVGAETLSRFLDPEDRATVILLGDGAGAAVLTRPFNPEQGVLYSNLGCDGSKTKLIWVPAGGSLLPASSTTVAERLHYMHMKGREVYKFAVTKMQEMIDGALNETGLKPDDLKLVIPHQSNLRIIESVREKLGLPKEKIAINIDRYGNTSAASIPIALDEARRRGEVQPGDYIMMLALGAGLVWGTMIVRL
jgi:3-oxoacyl-[acyl-carrier-protein] synthase-3